MNILTKTTSPIKVSIHENRNSMICKRCNAAMMKNGRRTRNNITIQKYRCPKCGHFHEERITEAPSTTKEPDKAFMTADQMEAALAREIIKPTQPDKKQMGLTETQLRSKYDNRFIIKNKCQELKRGVYLTQSEFVLFCGIKAGAGYRDIMEHPDHDDFHGKAGGTIYWSHPESIKKLKDEGVLT